MGGNSFGQRFVVTTFGESHGGAVGVVIDGCPAGFPLDRAAIQRQLDRRRPGQSRLASQRKEPDEIAIQSGLDPETGRTLGTPLAMWVGNKDARSGHYDDIARLYRPSHADYTYEARFGIRAAAGGGRSSARETVGRVAAGAIAESILHAAHGIEIVAWVDRVAEIEARGVDRGGVDRRQVDASDTRCPDPDAAAKMEAAILAARKDGDTLGGVVRCVARGVPAGWGAPVFDKLTARLAGALMSLPASRGFEIGDGFASTRMRGSTHNDPFVMDGARVRTSTNHSGGIQGGITNGEAIHLAVAFKPVATIFKRQQTVTRDGQAVEFAPKKGRHDPCVLPRAVPMVEAMVALVLCDAMLDRTGVRMEDLS